MQSTPRGFTLVELVVVMAIIAVLLALGIFAIQAARQAGRNTERRSDVATIQTALEAYYAAQNPKSYPNCGNAPVNRAALINFFQGTAPCGPTAQLPPGVNYLPGMNPNDPSGDNNRTCYFNNGAAATGPGKYGLAMFPEPNLPVPASCPSFSPALDPPTGWENSSRK